MDRYNNVTGSVLDISVYVDNEDFDKNSKYGYAELTIKKGIDKTESHFTPHVQISFEQCRIEISRFTVMNARNEIWIRLKNPKDRHKLMKLKPIFYEVDYLVIPNGQDK